MSHLCMNVTEELNSFSVMLNVTVNTIKMEKVWSHKSPYRGWFEKTSLPSVVTLLFLWKGIQIVNYFQSK